MIYVVPDSPVEDPVWDEALLGVEVLVVVGPDDAVVVDHDAVLLQEEVDVGVEALLAALAWEKKYTHSLVVKIIFSQKATLILVLSVFLINSLQQSKQFRVALARDGTGFTVHMTLTDHNSSCSVQTAT